MIPSSVVETLAMYPDTYRCPAHGEYRTKDEAQSYRVQTECPVCKQAEREAIDSWHRAWRIYERWQGCGLPPRFRNRTFDNWVPQSKSQGKALSAVRAYSANLRAAYDDGRGLIVSGDLGVGKTHLIAGLVHEVIRNGFDCTFAAVGDLFADIKRSFGKDEDFDMQTLQEVSFLVLDDLGASRGTEWETSVLHELLRHRYDATLPTICTTNCADLERVVGARIADRFAENMVKITIAGASRRRDVSKIDGPGGLVPPPDEAVVFVCVQGVMKERVAESRAEENGLLPSRRR